MAAKRKRNRDHDDGPAEVLIPVSLLLDSGIPLEEISLLVGHKSTAVTELVYRKQIRPVLQTAAGPRSSRPPWTASSGPCRTLVTQIVTQRTETATRTPRKWPSTSVDIGGPERT